MKKISLYWNHICILHNFEKQYLSKIQEKLLKENIQLNIRYFGLGYEHHMCEYLSKYDDLPDIIVTADLEVIENHRLLKKLGLLHACQTWLSCKESFPVQKVQRSPFFLPLVIIPLIYYGHIPPVDADILTVAQQYQLGFGGINNSAVKTVVKGIWQQKGQSYLEKMLAKCRVYDMPINAFQSARTKEIDIALVPSLYGLRANQSDSYMWQPQEGPLLLPSYFLARRSTDEQLAKYVLQQIMQKELLNFYVQQGDLISCIANTKIQSGQEKMHQCVCVSQAFIDALDDDEFYHFYLKNFPHAHDIR